MDFNSYQKQALKTAFYLDKISDEHPDTHDRVFKALGLAYAGLGLGEAGEAQNKIKKIIRDKGGRVSPEDQEAIGQEIGGLLWYCAAVASELNLKLGDIAEENIAILRSRQERGKLTGSGDNR